MMAEEETIEEMGEISIEETRYAVLHISNIRTWEQLQEHLQNYIKEREISSDMIERLHLEKSNIVCFPADAFSDLLNLTTFKVEYSKMTTLSTNTFEVLNKLKELTIGNEITEIPIDFFNSLSLLELLDLTGNKIETIENGTFSSLTNLKRLVMSYSGLKYIRPGAFKGLGALEALDLFDNTIEALEKNLFEGLKNLKVLNLSFNELHFDSLEVLDGLDSLQELKLGGNKAIDLTAVTFINLKNLREISFERLSISCIPEDFSQKFVQIEMLDLSYNALTDIHPKAFQGLNKIKKIYLTDCKFTNLQLECFKNIQVGRTLDVSFIGNNLKVIPKETFKDFCKITSLCLECCKIEIIEPGTFKHLPSLGELKLHCNSIQKLEAGMFDGLTQLRRLELEVNKIETIEDGCFRDLKALTFLNLGFNKLTCLKKEVFKDLTSLMWLALNYNILKYVEKFEGLTNLRCLDLCNNWLKCDLENCCEGLNQLTYLHVRECELKNIGILTSGILNKLLVLDIIDNGIQDLSLDFFKHISPTCIVKLHGNKIPNKTLADIFKKYPNLTIYEDF